MAIISKKTGKIPWKMGSDYSATKEAIGVIIGKHHAHMILEGLPEAGNILVFDSSFLICHSYSR